MAEDYISIFGARQHNLKNIDLEIPRDQLVVITGVSGSGKSSLAFDTVHAEGQRRYLESFSAYARQFIGDMKAPDVDKIEGLSPVIAIEQKTTSRNPRSTVGTVTEIYDLFRLFYARAADAYSIATGNRMVKMSDDEIVKAIEKNFFGRKVVLCAPLVKGRKGHYRELFETLGKQGYAKVRIDGEIQEIERGMKVDRYKIHDIEVVIDRLLIGGNTQRLQDSTYLAMNMGEGSMLLLDHETEEEHWYSRNLMDPESGTSYDEPSPNSFSFNSPYGACPRCNGLAYVFEVDRDAIITSPDTSINKGALAPLGEYRDIWMFRQLRKLAKHYDFSMAKPWSTLPEAAQKYILEGPKAAGERKLIKGFEGLVAYIQEQYQTSSSEKIKQWAEGFMKINTCPKCEGARLKQESLMFKFGDKNIADLARMDISTLREWTEETLPEVLSERQKQIGTEVMKEINKRLDFLLEVGLGYLNLDRPAKTLSGGEAQRIRLATQIGSQLTGVLYILDEPSIGLHQRDNERLIGSLVKLRDLGNSVLVVEHDKDMMLASDYLIDFGPGAGKYGGQIVAQGPPDEFIADGQSSTVGYLTGKKTIPIPEKRRKIDRRNMLKLIGASGNNLQDVTLEVPLGVFMCVTGVSGSGKSTLVNETLYRILNQFFYRARKNPMPYKEIKGLDLVTKIIEIDQSPIGRTPRSNPATYTGVFTFIREFFAQLPESKIRGYKPGRFSFNVKGGRCEDCGGAGIRTIEMNFLPDVYVECETCQGRRYNRETLEIRYRGKSISDILNMNVSTAVEFFDAHPRIKRKLVTLQDVGLGYITLGQPATTLSGGEAQRVKVATELSKRDTGSTVYILDEPTTGLHFRDIEMLLAVLNRLVDRGNTVIVIEHNLDVIKVADWIVDMGPEGGAGGGTIVVQGPPDKIAACEASHTGRFLKRELAEAQTVASMTELI